MTRKAPAPQPQPGAFPLQDEAGCRRQTRPPGWGAGAGPLPFAQGLIKVVHVEDDGDGPAYPALQDRARSGRLWT